MKLTQDSLAVVEHNQHRACCEKGADILTRLFPEVIEWRKLPYELLLNLVAESYQWTELQKRPSQLLAVRIACARLCLGSFFMQDPRYQVLQDIVKQQLNSAYLTDDDPIYQYLVQFKPDWVNDVFQEQSSFLADLVATPSSQIDYQDWMQRMVINDWRLSTFKLKEQYQTVFEMLKGYSQIVLKDTDESLQFLITVAQYYEGVDCFNDPINLRWNRCIVPNAPVLTHHNIIKAFKSGAYL